MNEDLRLERTLRGTIMAGQNQTHAAKPHEVQQVAQVTLYQCRAENADAGGPMVYSYDITAAIVAVGETVILLHPPFLGSLRRPNGLGKNLGSPISGS